MLSSFFLISLWVRGCHWNFNFGIGSHTWARKKYYIRQAICQNLSSFWADLGWAQSIWKYRNKNFKKTKSSFPFLQKVLFFLWAISNLSFTRNLPEKLFWWVWFEKKCLYFQMLCAHPKSPQNDLKFWPIACLI